MGGGKIAKPAHERSGGEKVITESVDERAGGKEEIAEPVDERAGGKEEIAEPVDERSEDGREKEERGRDRSEGGEKSGTLSAAGCRRRETRKLRPRLPQAAGITENRSAIARLPWSSTAAFP